MGRSLSIGIHPSNAVTMTEAFRRSPCLAGEQSCGRAAMLLANATTLPRFYPAEMRLLIVLVTFAALAGCQRTPPPTPRPAPPKIAAKSKPTESKAEEPAKTASAAKEQDTDKAKTDSPAAAKAGDSGAKTAAKAEPTEPAAKAEVEPAA